MTELAKERTMLQSEKRWGKLTLGCCDAIFRYEIVMICQERFGTNAGKAQDERCFAQGAGRRAGTCLAAAAGTGGRPFEV